AHRNTGQIKLCRVSVEFLYRLIERGQRLFLHSVLRPPEVLAALRHDHDCWEAVDVAANRPADSDLGLNEAVVTAFAGAVQEKYHGPFPVLVPIARHINLVAVSFIAELDGSVEKACFVRAGARSQSEEDGAEQNRSRGFSDRFHLLPRWILHPHPGGVGWRGNRERV